MTACPKGKCLLTGCQNTGESLFALEKHDDDANLIDKVAFLKASLEI